jgi:hypothetical protein
VLFRADDHQGDVRVSFSLLAAVSVGDIEEVHGKVSRV